MTEQVPVSVDQLPVRVSGELTVAGNIQVRESPLRDVQLRLVRSIDDAMDLKRWLGERRETSFIGLDTETAGLDPHRFGLRMIQFGDLRTGWAVPWPLWGGAALEILNAWEGEWVLHNAQFDARFLKVHAGWELPWHRTHNTMIQLALVDPLRPKGLKAAATRYVDATATRGEKLLHDGMRQQGWTWGTVPYDFDPYWVYGALDPVLTTHLCHQFLGQVQATCPEAYDLERAAERVCSNMMLAGLLVDQPYVAAERAKLREFAAESRTWLQARHGITSPMSAGQISRALAALGHPVTRFTPKGYPQVDKATLTAYRDHHPDILVRDLARYVLAVRHTEKICTAYLDNFTEMVDADGLIHASINILAARTGRMSVTDPALQTLPRDDEVVRGSFIPHPGMALVSCDLDQVEARLAAHFSNDPGLIQAFLDADAGGADFFCGVASGIFGETITKGDPRRQLTKNVVYGKLFGGGLETMARTAGVDPMVMKPVKDAFEARFPGLQAMTDQIMREAEGYDVPCVFTPLRRRLVADHGRAYTQLTNAKIQGHAAEYFKMRLVDLDAAGLGPYLRLPIHDEELAEVPADEAEEICREIERLMSDRVNYRVPITAGGKVMRERWRKGDGGGSPAIVPRGGGAVAGEET